MMEQRDIRLVGLDLDGTVLDSNKQISARTLQTIARANAQGCLVIPATGRPLAAVPREFLEIPGVDYAVTSNGATVVETATGNILCKTWLTVEQVQEVRRLVEGLYLVWDVFVEGQGYTQQKDLDRVAQWAPKGMEGYLAKTRKPVEDMEEFIGRQVGFEKCNLFFDDEAKRSKARQLIEQLGCYTVVSSTESNLEISAPGADKGTALLALGRKLGIAPQQVMACGDSENDAAMLQAVGLSVAMGNAPESIRQLSHTVTDTNDRDGVAKALERYVLRL